MNNTIRRATQCPICGRTMTHYRLRGYQCHDERHNEQARELFQVEVSLMVKHPDWSEEKVEVAARKALGLKAVWE